LVADPFFPVLMKLGLSLHFCVGDADRTEEGIHERLGEVEEKSPLAIDYSEP